MKKKVFSVVSWLYFIAAFVMLFLFLSLVEPTGGNLFAASMMFSLCMLGAIGYRSCSKVILLLVICGVFFTSCSRKGYGCRGNSSWKQMVERNNKPY